MLQTRPTHHSHNSQSSSLIDLMLVLQEHKVTRYGQLPAPGISRHDMLYLAYSVKVPKYPVQFVTYRDIKGIDSDLLLESFGSLDWEPLLSESDVNRKTELLRIKILEVFDEFAPLTESRVTRPPIPWMNASIKRCMRLRDKLWIKYRRTKSIEDRIAYNIQKNATNYAVRRAQKYFSRSILKGGSKSTWNRLRSLGLGKIKSSAPLHVGLDELNQYFVSVVPVPCPTVKNTILEEIENGTNAAPVSSDATFNFVEVSESDVSKAVLSIKSKASGYDGVDGKMVKLVLAQLLPILTHIFNESLSTGVFPFEWKSANVVPLQKVSSPSSCNDYRPISLLPILSKALEKLAIWQIMEFVESQSKLDLFQSGFRRRHSTATALVKVTDDVRLSLDAGKATILVLLDMSKAFDSVDFDVLIATLKGMGLSDNTLSWIGSYLRGRRQRVMHDGKYSEWKPINSGVPQGSVAGPLLFTIYITSLQRVFRHCKYHVYADDIQIYTHCWPRDIMDCIRQLNFELECFLKWAKGLFLHPNPTKTKVLAFGPKSIVNSLGTADLPPIVFDGVVLPLVSEARNLGVYIDNTLSWKCHVSEVRKRVFYSLHSLSKYRKTFPKELKKRLIEALVFPLFDYCDVVYPNLTDGLQQSLQLAQNACVRHFSFKARKLAVPLNGGSTHQAMNSVNNQWKLLNQLKDYLAKTSPVQSSSLNKASSEKHAIFELSKEWISLLQKYTPASMFGIHFQNLTLDSQDSTKKTVQGPKTARLTPNNVKKVIKTTPLPHTVEEVHPDKIQQWQSSQTGVSKMSILSATCHILSSIANAQTVPAKLKRTEELVDHITRYPSARIYAVKEGGVKILLRTRESHTDEALHQVIREALAILGYSEPLPGRGIRILSIDGGGIRGIAVIELLRKLEQISGRRISDMFDYICGVSTGSILLSTVGIPEGRTLDEALQLYMTLSTDLFTQNKLSGYTSMLLRHAYYDTDKFETFLREYIGETPMIQTNRQRKCPKLSVVSTVVNHDKVWPYVFRNYCIPYERKSQYMGDHKYAMWQAVRASSAAPSIFDEFHLDGLVHQDGGMTVNNPAAVAIHEATLLWPGAPLQCIVSCGTGRTLPKLNATPYSHDTQSASDSAQTAGSSLWHKMVKILESATDTEGVHTCLSDLLPQGVYYRFNPYLSEVPDLDETRPEKLAQLRLDTDIYIRKNEAKFQAATQCLLREKSLVAKMSDYVTRRAYVWNAHL
ncbi:hypothetical protein M8J77_002520 [Diaphorina citri]|nr:hypothetical protein M8J77_002520 [Diaphorina citri]